MVSQFSQLRGRFDRCGIGYLLLTSNAWTVTEMKTESLQPPGDEAARLRTCHRCHCRRMRREGGVRRRPHPTMNPAARHVCSRNRDGNTRDEDWRFLALGGMIASSPGRQLTVPSCTEPVRFPFGDSSDPLAMPKTVVRRQPGSASKRGPASTIAWHAHHEELPAAGRQLGSETPQTLSLDSLRGLLVPGTTNLANQAGQLTVAQIVYAVAETSQQGPMPQPTASRTSRIKICPHQDETKLPSRNESGDHKSRGDMRAARLIRRLDLFRHAEKFGPVMSESTGGAGRIPIAKLVHETRSRLMSW